MCKMPHTLVPLSTRRAEREREGDTSSPFYRHPAGGSGACSVNGATSRCGHGFCLLEIEPGLSCYVMGGSLRRGLNCSSQSVTMGDREPFVPGRRSQFSLPIPGTGACFLLSSPLHPPCHCWHRPACSTVCRRQISSRPPLALFCLHLLFFCSPSGRHYAHPASLR